MKDWTPQAIVQELDRYIVGQSEAKRAVAVALRNRQRRLKLPPEVRREITPKNILMIGPTGVGKTEIARRMAALVDAPFLKVEATQFTEVGYVGRDVDAIVQDLVEAAVMRLHESKMREVQAKAEGLANERLVTYLCQQAPALTGRRRTRVRAAGPSGAAVEAAEEPAEAPAPTEPPAISKRHRRKVAALLADQKLEDHMVEIEIGDGDSEPFGSVLELSPGMSTEEITETVQEFMDTIRQYGGPRGRRRRMSVREARRVLTMQEASRLVDMDQIVDAAVEGAQENGIVFIDELDKIVGPKLDTQSDISGEGVQRDLLPIVEGATVMTRYGPVKTDHVLFIGAGAFQHSKPSDLIPELQGRFPLRVELSALSEADLCRILLEPENSLIKQYQALLSVEDVELIVTEDGIRELARMAARMNERMENIGARRLHTIMERVLEDVSFSASELEDKRVVVDAEYVRRRLDTVVQDEDLSRYIL